MEIKQIREIIKDLQDDVEVFAPFYEIDEADEYISSNYEDENQPALSKAEWSKIVHKMQADDGIWQVVTEAFNYYIDQVVEDRKEKANANQ